MSRKRKNKLWDRLDLLRRAGVKSVRKEIQEQSLRKDFRDQCSSIEKILWQLLRRNPSFQEAWETPIVGSHYEAILYTLTQLEIDIEFSQEEENFVSSTDDYKRACLLDRHRFDLLNPIQMERSGVSCSSDSPMVLLPEFIEVLNGHLDQNPNLWKNGYLRSKFSSAAKLPNPDDLDLKTILSAPDKKSRVSKTEQMDGADLFKSVMGRVCSGTSRSLDIDAQEMAIVIGFSRPDLGQVLSREIQKLERIKRCLNMPNGNIKKVDQEGLVQRFKIFDALMLEKNQERAFRMARMNLQSSTPSDRISKLFSGTSGPTEFIDFIENPNLIFQKLTRHSDGPVFEIIPEDL